MNEPYAGPDSIQGFETVASAIDTAENYTRWVVSQFRPYIGRRVVEVGLGHANFLPHFGDLEAYLGIDIDADVVARAQKRHPARNFSCIDACDSAFVTAARLISPDTIICFNVLEHLVDDQRAVSNMLEPLQRGGHLCVFVPAMPSIFGRLDELAGHVRRYTLKTARALKTRPVDHLVRSQYFNPIGALGWWLNNYRGHDSLENASISSQVRMFDKFVVPLSRGMDPLTQHLFGQSIVVVIQRG
jgi:SAM-dependent methyltransferase